MTKLGEVPDYRLPGDYGKQEPEPTHNPNEVRTWRTARKQHRCDDANTWGHPGVIEAGSRYLEIVVLRSDVFPTPVRFRVCEACA